MKVLFCVRHNFHSSPGGAQIQILKTSEYLRKLGVECDITTTPHGVDYDQYDIVHLTDLTWVYDLLVYLKALKDYKGPKVLSTIYWPFDDYAGNGAPFIQKMIFKILGINGFEYAKSLAKFVKQREKVYLLGLKKSYIANQKLIASQVDWMLPNAELEMAALNQRLGLSKTNYSVVNNAIDTAVFDEIIMQSAEVRKSGNSEVGLSTKCEMRNAKCEGLTTEPPNQRSTIITFVARIDPRKNQLNFLKAMMDTDYTIKFIGSAGPNSQSYYKKLQKLAVRRGNVEFISHIPQEEVFKHMLSAKVNVLTSWVETPGLVSLEAAYAGCNIVVSEKGSVRDYFKDYAFYCQPDDLKSIRTAVEKAMKAEYNPEFREIIRSEYSWLRAAEQTLEGYRHSLRSRAMC